MRYPGKNSEDTASEERPGAGRGEQIGATEARIPSRPERLKRRVTHFACLSLLVAGTTSVGSPALAVPPSTNGAAPRVPTLTDLAVLENRFFSHPYSQDPVDKRLERLECMVFGGIQGGSNEARLTKLMKVVAERAQKPIAQDQTAKVEVPKGEPAAKDNGGEAGKYPVLNTLEWRALKKTFPNESLDQRLDRLESKMFGQPAQSMAYFDRVERLRKTLGIGIETGLDTPLAGGVGPAPRARAGTPDDDSIGSGRIGRPFGGGGGLTPSFPGMSPDLGFGFGFPAGIFDATFDKQLHQMMEQMNKQMAEARRLGSGRWRFDPKSNSWVDLDSGRKVSPDTEGAPRTAPGPRISPMPPSVAPQRRLGQPNMMEEIPPYADPNSI
jgi:hypothetical protein